MREKKKKLDSIIINFGLVSVMFPKPQGYNFWQRKTWSWEISLEAGGP